jgi:hypothetical protein
MELLLKLLVMSLREIFSRASFWPVEFSQLEISFLVRRETSWLALSSPELVSSRLLASSRRWQRLVKLEIGR